MAFKMKGHTLPGINQNMDKSSKPDGRAKSSAFQKAPVAKQKTSTMGKIKALGNTIVQGLDPDEKLGNFSSNYKSNKKKQRSKSKKTT